MIIWIRASYRDQNTDSVNKHNQFHPDYRAVEHLQRQKTGVYDGFLPQSKDLLVCLTGNSKLSVDMSVD